jgi:hypothetical protein
VIHESKFHPSVRIIADAWVFPKKLGFIAAMQQFLGHEFSQTISPGQIVYRVIMWICVYPRSSVANKIRYPI